MNFKFRHFKSNLQIQKGAMDITPLIDVVFQLLIFFLLSSSFVLQPGIKVDLPAVRLSSGEKPSELSVSIRKDGKIFFNDKGITLEILPDILQKKRDENPEAVLMIKADQKARHGMVVEVMAAAKQVGISRIAIATKPGFSQEVHDEER